jgi:hypothetical protein
MDLHGQIMNLPARLPSDCAKMATATAYKTGHRDARHAAAELALKADACVEALRDILMHVGEGRGDAVEWVCEPIHSDEIRAAREALAELDGRVLVSG